MNTTVVYYLYYTLTGVFCVSLILLICVYGMLPFGVRGAWVDEGVGHRMAITIPVDQPGVSQPVAFWSDVHGGVHIAQIEETARVDGMQFYRPVDGEWAPQYAASRVQGEVLFSVPLVGFLVRALIHPIGLLAAVGAPLVMLLADLVQVVYLQERRRFVADEEEEEEAAGNREHVRPHTLVQRDMIRT